MEEVKGELKEPEKDIEKRKSKLNKFLFGWVKDNYDKAFLFILAIAFAVGIWVFVTTKGQPLWYDAANFLSTAKKFAFNLTNVNDIWYYRRGFLWVLISAIFFKLGLGEIGIQFTGVLFYTGFVFVSYLLLKEMFEKKIALFATSLLAFSWVLLFFIGRCMTDIPAAFFLILSLFFFWKGYVLKKGNKYLYLFGLFLGITALTRFEAMIFIFPFFVYVFLDQKFKLFLDKKIWITLGIFLLTILPHLILYSLHYGFFLNDIFSYYLGVGTTVAGSAVSSASTATFSNLFDYFKDLPYCLTTVLLVAFIIGALYFFANLFIGADKIFKDKEIQKKFFIFVWIIFPMLVLGWINAGAIEERYIIPIFPFLFLIAAIPFIKLEELSVKHLKMKQGVTLILVFLILLGTTIPGIIWANNLIDNKKTSYLQVEQSALWIKANSNPSDIVLSNSIPYMTYYAERTCYGIDPNETVFEQNITNIHPKFLMLSIFEPHQPWMYLYPQNHTDTLKPVQAFYLNQQPAVVVYEFVNPQQNINLTSLQNTTSQ